MQALLPPAILGLFTIASTLNAEDWPAYRHDGQRSAVSATKMAAKIFPQWTFQPRHIPSTAWPLTVEEEQRMHSDRAYHAVITGTTLVFGNNVDNHVYALDTRTGKLKWSFAAEGSVRFAPMIDGGRI